VVYDLELFRPIKNASTTFHFEDLRFVPLRHQQHQQQQQQQLPQNQSSSSSPSSSLPLQRSTQNLIWMVPDVDDATNHISTSMVQSFINTSSNTDTGTSIDTTRKICQIFCRFRTQSFGYTHFPHFLQQALPCWNLFHYFANHQQSSIEQYRYSYYMILPENIEPTSLSSYIQEFIKVMEQSSYHIQMIYGFEESLPVHNNCDQTTGIPSSSTTLQQQPTDSSISTSLPSSSLLPVSTSMSIMAIKYFSDTGWDRPCKYFLSTNKDDHSYFDAIQQIQQEVLQNQYIATTDPSTFQFEIVQNMKYQIIQVLLLDRKQSSRDFKYANDTVTALQNFVYTNHNTDMMYRLNVAYIPSFMGYTLYDQALSIHSADIIYSPHGAQLSNLVYIRPCTVVVEFFPKDYYIQFFQAFVENAYGVSYEGYPMTNGSKVTDTQQMLQGDRNHRREARSYPIPVTSQFFTQTIPQ
jgi:hypothetical protein